MATSNDKAWQTFLETEKLDLDGRAILVEANRLRQISNREPRLLAKFDMPNELPKIFRDKGYSLLAVENGKYLLFQGNTFHRVGACDEQENFASRLEFPLLTVGRGTGESEYLDNAVNIGMLSEFVGVKKLYLTIRGRERSRPFSFFIGQVRIYVDGVQIEVDGGYEGDEDIVLVEAKIGADKYFNVRQLYYPYRHFSLLAPTKRVRTVYFQYDVQAATYSMYEYGFSELTRFDSIELYKCKVYSIVARSQRTIDELRDAELESRSNIVPQADDLNKVLELLTLINQGRDTKQEIADFFTYDERQSLYYGEAAEYLGMISRHRGYFELTERGILFISLPPNEQQFFAAKVVINSWVFLDLLRIANRKGFFNWTDIEHVLARATTLQGSQRYSKSTIPRRRQTIIAWSNWIAKEIGCFTRDKDRYFLK